MTVLTYDHLLRATLRQLLLPAAERLAIAKAAVGSSIPPACLDDAVMNALRERGYVSQREVVEKDIPVGAQVSTVGDGRIFLVEATFEGRVFLARGA